MSCRAFRRLLEESRDRVMRLEEQAAFAEHARRCASCAEVQREEAALGAALAAAQRIHARDAVVPPHFRHAVAAALPVTRGRAPRQGWRVSAAAATIVVGVACAVLWRAVEQGRFERGRALLAQVAAPAAASAPRHGTDDVRFRAAADARATSSDRASSEQILWSNGAVEVVGREAEADVVPVATRPPVAEALLVEWNL